MSGSDRENRPDENERPRRGDAAEATGHTGELERLAGRAWIALEAADDAINASAHYLDPAQAAEQRRRLSEDRASMIGGLHHLADDLHTDTPLLHWLDIPAPTRRLLGLPTTVQACVFDLDSVLTTSSDVHLSAWAETLDGFLLERAVRRREVFIPFDRSTDYVTYLAGRPRVEGVRLFLASRGLTIPEGRADDAPTAETVHGLSNRKAQSVQRHVRREGVAAYIGSRCYLEAAGLVGIGRAVVSASLNADDMLERAGLAGLIDARIDAHAIAVAGMRSKPAPDTLLAACERLGVRPGDAAAFDTTPAGIEAAHAAGMALVVGLRREGASESSQLAGADMVVRDLAELLDHGGSALR